MIISFLGIIPVYNRKMNRENEFPWPTATGKNYMPKRICPKCGKDITCPYCNGRSDKGHRIGGIILTDPCKHCGGSGKMSHDCTPYIQI
jgi:DnaJ-class molecular chaperone